MGSHDEPSKSHFAHFYDNKSSGLNGHNGHSGIQGNGTLGNDDMRVSAGIVYRSPPNGHPSEVTGSFVTATMNGQGRPASMETTIVRPDSDHNDGRSEIIDTSPQGGGDAIGHVTFSRAHNDIPNGVHSILQFNGSRNILEQNQKSSPLPDPFQLFQIEVLVQSKCYFFDVKVTYTVERLKRQILDRVSNSSGPQESRKTEQYFLLFDGKTLDSKKSLGYYGVKEGSKMCFDARLRGG